MSNNDTKPSFLFPKWDLQQVSSSLFLPLAALVVRWCPMQEGHWMAGWTVLPSPSFPDTGSSLPVASTEQSPGEALHPHNASPIPRMATAGEMARGCRWTFSLNASISFESLRPQRFTCISNPCKFAQPWALHQHLGRSGQQRPAWKGQAASRF